MKKEEAVLSLCEGALVRFPVSALITNIREDSLSNDEIVLATIHHLRNPDYIFPNTRGQLIPSDLKSSHVVVYNCVLLNNPDRIIRKELSGVFIVREAEIEIAKDTNEKKIHQEAIALREHPRVFNY